MIVNVLNIYYLFFLDIKIFECYNEQQIMEGHNNDIFCF